MKQKRRSNFFANISLAVLAVFLILALPGISKARDVKKHAKIKPDIIIKNFIVVPTVTPDGGDLSLAITVYLYNGRKDTSTGPFYVRVDWTENPTKGWNLIKKKRINNLVNSSSLAKVQVKSFTLYHTIPAGAAYKYRVIADFKNKVDEGPKGETNNVASKAYTNR
jgi:hypothetical protein